MTEVIVFASLAFAIAFTVLWLVRPDVRVWLERPKHRFQKNVQTYDQAQQEREREREQER